MRNTKNNETQCVLTAQELQEQFNIATHNLVDKFAYKDLKPCIDNLLLGWLTSDYFELRDTSNRGTIFEFFTNSLEYYKEIETHVRDNQNHVFTINFFNETMNCKSVTCYKVAKKTFNQTLKYFLESTTSNDNEIRTDVLYKVDALKNYFKHIFKIKKHFSCFTSNKGKLLVQTHHLEKTIQHN
ncbi:hypothetical protein [Flavobacterium sp.]|uniref:hypothetical protein n=1 Tax=Flavobacterium sp. TaxID=239 RepID=UPI00375077F1